MERKKVRGKKEREKRRRKASNTMSDDERGPADLVKDLMELGRRGSKFIDENEDLIRSVVGPVENRTRVRVTDMQPLTEVQLTDKRMLVTVEVTDASMDSVNLSANGDELTVMYGGEEVVVEEVPDDVRLKDGEANMNNGVLTLNIPRDKTGEEKEED